MITVEQQIAYMERLIAGYGENDAASAILSTLRQQSRLVAALEREHEWAEKLAKRIRDAVYASEELKDPLAFKDLDEYFFNGIAASYQAEYDAALSEVPQK